MTRSIFAISAARLKTSASLKMCQESVLKTLRLYSSILRRHSNRIRQQNRMECMNKFMTHKHRDLNGMQRSLISQRETIIK